MHATLQAGADAGTVAGPLWPLALGASIFLVPMLTFFNLWPNWGSTLYGEVRGATDYKRNLSGMLWAIIVTTVGAVLFFILIGKTIGWDFYNKANGAFWNWGFGYTTTTPPLPIWPYPALFAAFLVKSPALMFIIVLLMSLWWFGWSGTLFLSSTRVIFAAAIDRMLPEWVSKIEPRTKTPINALLLMVIPSAIISYLYAFKVFSFQTLALDATVVIAITFLGSTIAGIVMPWRAKDVFDGSPIARYKVPAWLGWIVTAVYGVFSIYLIYISFKYAWTIISGLGAVGANGLTWFVVIVLGLLTIFNASRPAVSPVLCGQGHLRQQSHAPRYIGRTDLPGLPRLAAGGLVLGSDHCGWCRYVCDRLVECQLDGLHDDQLPCCCGNLLWLQCLPQAPGN